MKQFNKTILAASVAAAALGSVPAHALWTTGSATVNVISQGVATAKGAVKATADTVYKLSAGESLTINDTVTIDLTGGVKFSSNAPQLTCSTGDLGAGVGSAAVPLTGGTAGSTSATWRAIDDKCAAGATLTFASNAVAAFDVTGVGTGSKADFLLTLETSTGIPIGTASHSMANESTGTAAPVYAFAGTSLFSLGTTPSVVSTGNVAQVPTSYTLFGAPSTTVTAAASLFLDSNNAAGAIPSAAIAANELLYTVAGDLSGVADITATGLESSAGAADGAFDIDVTGGEATASNDAAIAAGASFNITDLVVEIDGTSTQAARTLTLAVELDGDTNYAAHTVYPASPAVVITRDGTFFTTSSTGPANTIKITDTSGSASASGGQITVKAYDAAGLAVAQAAGAPALPAGVVSNGTTSISGADLAANFPGAVRFDFTVNTVSASIANVKKTADGTNLTVYENVSGNAL